MARLTKGYCVHLRVLAAKRLRHDMVDLKVVYAAAYSTLVATVLYIPMSLPLAFTVMVNVTPVSPYPLAPVGNIAVGSIFSPPP